MSTSSPGSPRRAASTKLEVLRLAAGVESDSEHPLAKAIVAAAKERGEVAIATGFRALTGRGVEATIDDVRYAVGGPALLRERNLAVPEELQQPVEEWRHAGCFRALPRTRR